MQITLDFTQGVNPPDSMRDIILLSKINNTILSGYYSLAHKKYHVYTQPSFLKPEQVMWAEQPNNINNNKKTIV